MEKQRHQLEETPEQVTPVDTAPAREQLEEAFDTDGRQLFPLPKDSQPRYDSNGRIVR